MKKKLLVSCHRVPVLFARWPDPRAAGTRWGQLYGARPSPPLSAEQSMGIWTRDFVSLLPKTPMKVCSDRPPWLVSPAPSMQSPRWDPGSCKWAPTFPATSNPSRWCRRAASAQATAAAWGGTRHGAGSCCLQAATATPAWAALGREGPSRVCARS